MLWVVGAVLGFDQGYGAYQGVLDGYVRDGRVDYAGLKGDGRLDGVLGEVAGAPVGTFTAEERKAFFINSYNALTLDLVADNYPIRSIMELDGGKVWDTRRFKVGGESLTLNEIENGRLRPLGDPRIHAAINCAARSCPPLQGKAFLPGTLEKQLDAATRAWVATMNVSGGYISVSKIFEWFSADFARYGSTPQAAAIGFIGAYSGRDLSGVQVRFAEYDWGLNGR